MKRLFSILTLTALAATSFVPAFAQSTSPTQRIPAWTGAMYPPDRHIFVMLLHFNDAALAMAQAAQKSTTKDNVKNLAADVIAQRSRDLTTEQAAYRAQYGQAPPAWGNWTMGANGMMSGSANGMMNGSTNGMMNGSGNGMMGSGGMTGQMMTTGDGYQMMMGYQSNWWGTSGADTGFVPALIRLDAMEISMATLGLRSHVTQTKTLCRTILSARTTELARLSNMLATP